MTNTMLAAGILAAIFPALSAQGQEKPHSYAAPEAEQAKPSSPLPPAMHFCALHCATFTLDNGLYVKSAGGVGGTTVMKIEKFTPESVIIHRTDTDMGQFNGTHVYSAPMDASGNGFRGENWRMTWGAGLNDIPGTEKELIERAGGQQLSPAQSNMMLLQFLFALFSGGGDSGSSEPRKDPRSMIGCAPTYHGAPCH
jgi:hypothetical protein